MAILPIAMNGTFAGEQLALELAIESCPLTMDLSKPYAGVSPRLAAIADFSPFGFDASRGDELLSGRPLLD